MIITGRIPKPPRILFSRGGLPFMKSTAPATSAPATDGLKLTENCRTVLAKRYLKRNEDGTVTETAADMFRRVARIEKLR